jgi:hypothetical protein
VFYRDLKHIMSLELSDLDQYVAQATRIAKERVQG